MRMERMAAEERDTLVLATIVRSHILTGAPVASDDVARAGRRRISSATVRNVMARLEEDGYLHQPHTSAGRIPTAKAYVFYVRQVASHAQLNPQERSWISRHLAAAAHPPEQIWARASHVLSEFTHGVALVVALPLAKTVLEELRLVRLSDRRVLVVVLARTGAVRDKVVTTRESYRTDELDRMATYLNDNFRGWTLDALREELERRLAAERSRYRRFLETALALCQQGVESAPGAADLYVEGTPHLLEGSDVATPDELRALFEALEERERLARLLQDCLASPGSAPQIRIGLEQLSPAMGHFALISARCGEDTGPLGSVGILGPRRMDYGRAISAVTYIARLLTESAQAAPLR